MVLSRLNRRYTAQKDEYDPRDLQLDSHPHIGDPSPSSSEETVDLRPFCGPVKNQEQLGCCTGFANVGMREFLYRKYFQYEKNQSVQPEKAIFSPLFVYYKERELEGTVNQDEGASMRTGVRVLNSTGVCLETSDRYDIDSFRNPPSAAQLEEALSFRGGSYHTFAGVEQMKSVLRSGYVFTAGISVYESFEDDYTARSGDMLMPDVFKEKCLGGHAILFVGFSDKTEKFIVRNSWGTNWGDGGNFHLGYRIAANPNFVYDAWTMHLGPAWKPKQDTPEVTQATAKLMESILSSKVPEENFLRDRDE